jgi:lipoprotein signal peptidase
VTAPVTPRRVLLLALLFTVVAADQGGKWWAWRYCGDAQLNFGSGPMLGNRVGHWYADPSLGAWLDIADSWVLAGISWVTVRRRRPVAVSAFGMLAVAGWDSNLLDRLGLHDVTAPGSRRGVVDFIVLGSSVYNVADFAIMAGTVLLGTALITLRLRSHYFPEVVAKIGPDATTSPK